MRKVYFTLAFITLSLATLGPFNPHSVAKSVAVIQDTAGAAPPGSRCTRLRAEKRRRPSKGSTDRKSSPLGLGGPGSRCLRLSRSYKGGFLPNAPPKVGLSASTSHLGPDAGAEVRLRTIACDPEDDSVLYTYSTTAGRIVGDGPDVVWDLSGTGRPGHYIATVEVDDGCGCVSSASAEVTVPEVR